MTREKRGGREAAACRHVRLREWPEAERPRERLAELGAVSLGDSELIALLIGSGTRGMTAVDLGKQLLLRFGGLLPLSGADPPELTRLEGIGPACAARLSAAFELGRRVAESAAGKQVTIGAPSDAVGAYGHRLRTLKTEVFQVLLLNNANQVIRHETVTTGTLNASIVHPREVFKAAVDHRSAGIILLHNHPSGNRLPSPEDRRVTRQMIKAGDIMGIPVVDHIIIAGDTYYSFAEEGGLN
ncbi:DNA repair protein RadC [bacterium]|nr:DNA repair protein RadC [bacterium]